MNLDNVNDAIEQAATDITSPEPIEETTDAVVDATVAPTDEAASVIAPIDTDTETNAAKDEFAERFGIQGQSFTGKENRIPYSRVKKIVAKAEKDREEAIRKTLTDEYTPKIGDFETKIKDYETKLNEFNQLEKMIFEAPQEFLGRLSQHPVYKPFFDQVNQLMAQQQTGQPNTGIVRDPQTGRFMNPASPTDPDPMPQPNVPQPDGSMLYSDDQFQKYMDWRDRQVEARITKQFEQRYAPIEKDFQAQRRTAELMPQIEKQIAEARQWDRFSELESEIIQLLQQNPNMSLDRAYMQAYQKSVVPKLVADKNAMRQEVLAELKKTPQQTAAPARVGKAATTVTGPRALEDVIREEAERAGGV